MKREIIDLNEIKRKITELKGSSVIVEVNRGRNKTIKFSGTIVSVYPSIFTVQTHFEKSCTCKTFSYFDVLCGDVKFVEG